jgi:hypothetical protein
LNKLVHFKIKVNQRQWNGILRLDNMGLVETSVL